MADTPVYVPTSIYPNADFPEPAVGLSPRGAFFPGASLVNGVPTDFPWSFARLLDAYNPKAIVADVTPLATNTTAPVPGVDRQFYFWRRPQNALSLYQHNGTGWVLIFAWGPTAASDTKNQLPAVTLTVNKTTLVLSDTLTLTAEASDADGTIIVVDFFSGSKPIGSANRLPYVVEFTPEQVGSYVLTAKATDSSGESRVSTPQNVTVVETAGEQASVVLSVPLNRVSEGTNLPLTALVAPGSSEVKTVDFLDGATKLNTVVEPPYAYTWKTVGVGVHTLRARMSDTKGLVFLSDPFTLTIDPPGTSSNQPPVVTGFVVTGNVSAVSSGTAITFTGSATDPDGSVTSIRYKENGQVVATTNGASGVSSAVTPTVGTHVYSAFAVDNQGAESVPFAATRTVVVSGATNQVPVVTAFSSSAPSGSLASGQPLTLTASGTDADGTVAMLVFQEGSTVVGNAPGPTGTSAAFTPTPGSHTYSAFAVDDKGAMSPAFAQTITLNVTSGPVVAPTFTKTLTFTDNTESTGTTLAASPGDTFSFNIEDLGAATERRMIVLLPGGEQCASVDFFPPYLGKLFSFFHAATNKLYYGRFQHYETASVTLSESFAI